jgi:exosortase D (VPLPA-CTERM-specific)
MSTVSAIAPNRKARSSWALWFLLAIPLALIFLPIIPDLLHDYEVDPDTAHGILVPFICIWLVWRKRQELAALPVRYSSWGIPVLVSGLLVFEISFLGHLAVGARLSFVVVVAGIVLLTLGKEFSKGVLFPIFFLVFLVPFPESLRGIVAFPLQLLATKVSAGILNAIGIVAVREGNVIRLLNTDLEVVAACSGIRSIIAYLMLGVLFAHLRRFRFAGAAVLVLLAIPIALAANVGRVVTSGILASFDPKLAQGFLHEFSGMALFAVGFAVFILLSSVLKRLFKEADARPDAEMAGKPRQNGRMETPPLAATLAALVLLSAAAGGTFALGHRPQVEVRNPQRLGELDMVIGDWVGEKEHFENEAEINKILDPTISFLRAYQRNGDRVSLYVGYYGTKKGGRSTHNPRSCYAGGGWTILENESIGIVPQGETNPVTVERLLVEFRGIRQEVLYWYQTSGSRVVADGPILNLLRLWRGVVENRNDGAFVRVTSNFQPGEEEHAAQIVREFSEMIIPKLAEYWPMEGEVR